MVTNKLKSKENMLHILQNNQLVNNSNQDSKNENGVDTLIKDTAGYQQVELNGFKNPINETRFPFLNKGLKSLLNQRIINLNVDVIDMPAITGSIYDYSNREDDIKSLEESMKVYKQQKPILVIRQGGRYVLVDGYLRIQALKNLEINVVRCVVSDYVPTNEDELGIFIVNNQIHKEKRASEKLNEVRYLLRIGMEKKNPNRDKEERMSTISNLLGKGFDRNNVYFLQDVIEWEEKNPSFNLGLQNKVVNNELKVARALSATKLIDKHEFTIVEEGESRIIDAFLNGKIENDFASRKIIEYRVKKSVPKTSIDLIPLSTNNYQLIQGDAETMKFPEGLETDVIFTSSPYYQLRKYGDNPNELGREKTPELFIKRLCDILEKSMETLKPTGSLFLSIGETYRDGQCLGIISRITSEMIRRDVFFVQDICWKKSGNKPIGNNVKRLISGTESILWFAKSKDYYFEKIKMNSDKKMKISTTCHEQNGNKKSFYIPNNFDQSTSFIDPSTFSKIDGYDDMSNIITTSISRNRVKFEEGEEEHTATFSYDLPLFPLLMTAPKSKDTVIMDIFGGTMSTGFTANYLGFKFVGIDLYEKNIKIGKRILNDLNSCKKED